MNSTDSSPAAGIHGSPRLLVLTIVGLVLGVLCGLFFGELCAPLGVLGNVFVGLLQMAVLPYLSVSLMTSLGRLDARRAWKVMRVGGLTLAGLWAIGLAVVLILPLCYPTRETGSFFSRSLVEKPAAMDLFTLFIPSNPFHALASNLVPAVVVFFMCLGIALMMLPDKEKLLAPLEVLVRVLGVVSKKVVLLSPIGVFALTAEAAGSFSAQEFRRLEAYLIVFAAYILLLTFVVLPLLVTCFTPIRFWQVFRVTGGSMITAMATGNAFIVLPQLVSATAAALADCGAERRSAKREAESLYPLAFVFPNISRFASLLFISFAAWFLGQPLSASQEVVLAVVGPPSAFAKPAIMVPLLLDTFRLPSDMYDLYLIGHFTFGSRLAKLLAVMYLFTLSTISASAILGLGRIQKVRLVSSLAACLLLYTLVVAGAQYHLSRVDPESLSSQRLRTLESFYPEVGATVRDNEPNEAADITDETAWQRVKRTGILRVGYHRDNLPFSFRNAEGDLVGFDVDMAKLLATDLACELELVPFRFRTLRSQLERGDFDIAMSGVIVTDELLRDVTLTGSYMEAEAAFLVPDHLRHQFQDAKKLKRSPFKVAVVRNDAGKRLQDVFPLAEIVQLNDYEEFFAADDPPADALMMPAQAGSAWSLAYPQYAVVIPEELTLVSTFAYAVLPRDRQLSDFVSGWIQLKKNLGQYNQIYDHWILGRSNQKTSPRWSVIRNVLHWVE